MASKGSAATRLQKEIMDFSKKPLQGVRMSLVEDNVCHWEVTIDGPAGTPYEGGVFTLTVLVTSDYPRTAPDVQFKTKIYHPNVNTNGSVCLDGTRNWKSATTIKKLVEEVIRLLVCPNADQAVSAEIAQAYRNNRSEFESQAKMWTAQYAQ